MKPSKHGAGCLAVLLAATVAGCSPGALAVVTPLPSASDPPPVTVTIAPSEAMPSTNPATSPTPSSEASPIAVPATATVAASATPSPLAEASPTVPPMTAAPTRTPLSADLPAGDARSVALATDIAFVPTARSPLAFDQAPIPLGFGEFYESFDIRRGLVLSDKLVSLDGHTVVMEGYMAPPLKAELDFFVLTRVRLSICPFCSTDADWPSDIALIYMPVGTTTISTQAPVRVTGSLHVGSAFDLESGMVSLVRIYADEVRSLP